MQGANEALSHSKQPAKQDVGIASEPQMVLLIVPVPMQWTMGIAYSCPMGLRSGLPASYNIWTCIVYMCRSVV